MGFIGKTNSTQANKVTPFSMAESLPVQTKLTVSKTSDPAEKEADNVARKVVDEQKNKKAASKKGDQKTDNSAPAPVAETTPEPKKEGLKTKENKNKKDIGKKEEPKKEIKKKSEQKEEKKAAKKEAVRDNKDKISKKDDKKQEVRKKSEQKEEKKAARKEENNRDRKPVDKEKETNAKPKSINLKESPAREEKPKIQQKPQEKTPVNALGKKDGDKATPNEPQKEEGADETRLKALEEKINARRGKGKPLNDQVKTEMEQSFSHDFSNVKVHDDKESVELCASLNAQAFTIGNDVFFSTGKYDPESDPGKELLAHELTHVVQQKDQVQRMIANRAATASGGTTVNQVVVGKFQGTSKITIESPALSLPKAKGVKHRANKYPKPLSTKAPFDRKDVTKDTDAQGKLWDDKVNSNVKNKVEALILKSTASGKRKNKNGEIVYYFEQDGIKLFGKKETIINNSKRPLWNRHGKVSAYDVDHVLELQLEGGENEVSNLELLNFSANRGSGRAIASSIRSMVGEFLKTEEAKKKCKSMSVKDVMNKYIFEFSDRKFDKETGSTPKGGDFWELDEINKGLHLENFTSMKKGNVDKLTGEKPDEESAFTSPVGGAQITKSKERMPGFTANIKINKNSDSALVDTEVGRMTGKLTVNPRIIKPMDISLPLYKMEGADNAGYIARRDPGKQSLETILRKLNFMGLSPVEIDSADLVPDKGIVAKGQIKPSVEIIKDLYIDFTIEGEKVELSRTFTSGEIKSIPPPLKISDASITIFAGTGGVGVRGNIDFEINRVGKGSVTGSGKSDGIFRLDGNFDFDEKLFGGVKSTVKASYEHIEGGEDKWDINGNIKIPKNKIKGIKSAEINVNYADKIFKADGTAKFDIPGLEDGKLAVTYGNDQLLIEGEANFKHKFIKSGNVKAKVETAGETTQVSLTGNAKPNIPGIDTDLSVSYIDGLITITGTVGYTKGRLSGTATVGVTNQAVGADGKPSGGPGKDLSVFGGGSLTLKITDWLQGTAGVTFKPDGNIEVVGKIGIPAAVDIFPKKEIKKEIFKAPTIEIPIFAVPVGTRSIGLVATIGGGADAYASIGPGQLKEAAVEVTYNPAHEENMKISGNAKFRVPAEAGLRLYVRAGIGLSIGIARVAGGLELGGALGIEGAAEAGVQVNWSPSQGFKLDAEASLYVQPKFKFDVNAYIEAVLDLWITSLSKEWKWNLYSFEYGPALRFGVKFPVHYEENKPFEISLSDVQFQTPEINVGDFAKGIGKQLIGA